MSTASRFSRVLVARLDSLGDVLLAGPAVRAVAASAKVTMLIRRGLGEAAEMLPTLSAKLRPAASTRPWC
jgi:ADP-heptose:LPS heptosyltransferase